jgi:hypothetical protein
MRARTVLYWNKFFKYFTLENSFLAAWIAFLPAERLPEPIATGRRRNSAKT